MKQSSCGTMEKNQPKKLPQKITGAWGIGLAAKKLNCCKPRATLA